MKAFRPNLESLSDRLTPTVGLTISGSTLIIQGDINANTISVTDNGTGAPGNITGVGDGRSFAAISGGALAGVFIDTVQFIGRNGNDTAAYTLAGPLTGVRNVYAGLGGGNDRFSSNLNGNVGAGSTVNLTVVGQSGNDTITTSVGPTLAGTLNQVIDSGNGTDSIFAGFGGTLTGTITSSILTGNGDDTVRTQVGLGAGSAGQLTSSIDVVGGDDTVILNSFNGGATTNASLVLDAQGEDVVIYTAVSGAPLGTFTLLNGENTTTINA